MAYTGKDKKMFIGNVFPMDYENLSKIFSVHTSSNDTTYVKAKNVFDVHPEYEIPYKVACMMLSADPQNRISGFDELKKKKIITKKGNTDWKDYMFQIPGIYKMLGIQRGYFLEQILEVLQKPLLFLYLVQIRLSCLEIENTMDRTLWGNVLKLAKKAMKAHKNKKGSNNFDLDQFDICFRFLFEYNLCESKTEDSGIYGKEEQGIWQRGSAKKKYDKYKEIESDLEKMLKEYMAGEGEEIRQNGDHTYRKGDGMSFPNYMIPIIRGLYNYQGILPFSTWEDEPENVTFWKNPEILNLLGVDEELKDVFYDALLYIFNKHMMTGNVISIMSCREIEKTDEYLERYYTFCMGTLYYVFASDSKNKEAAQYSFERLFSLYLFKEETDFLYSIVNAAADDLMKPESNGAAEDHSDQTGVGEDSPGIEENSREELEFLLAECMADCFSSNMMHEIFCSPGIYHRISLARHMIGINITKEMLCAAYSMPEVYEPSYCEEDPAVNDIQNLNKYYWCVERAYIRENVIQEGKEKIYYNEIKERCRLSPEEPAYKEFYKKMKEKIDGMGNGIKSGSLTHAKHTAANVLKNGKFKSKAYRFLHFWVIMSSFLPDNISFPELIIPTNSLLILKNKDISS